MEQDIAAEYISVMEVLATSEFPTGVNKSNQTTPPAADADDQ